MLLWVYILEGFLSGCSFNEKTYPLATSTDDICTSTVGSASLGASEYQVGNYAWRLYTVGVFSVTSADQGSMNQI